MPETKALKDEPVMRLRTVLRAALPLIGVAALSGCHLFRAPVDETVAAGPPLSIMGDFALQDGVAVDVSVKISADRNEAAVEVDGEERRMAWNGEQLHCGCRAYADDDFVLFVRFSGGDVAETGPTATLTRLDEEDPQLAVEALLAVEDGLKLKVVLVVADDKESVTFTHEGEPEMLAWDQAKNKDCACRSYKNERYEATVWWPAADKDGTATLARR